MVPHLARVGKLIARLMLGVLVFAQLTLAAQACMMPAMAPAAAFSADAMPGGCGVATKNACLAQWTAGDQATDSPHLAFHLAPPPYHPAAIPPARVGVGERLVSSGLDRQTGPPACLRYCRYLE